MVDVAQDVSAAVVADSNSNVLLALPELVR